MLHVESVGHAGGEFKEPAIDGMRVRYWLERDGDLLVLDDLQWADWDREGRMLAATRSGRLQVLAVGGESPGVVFDADLSALQPNPEPSPAAAADWS